VVAARASGIVLFSSGDLLEGKSIGAGQSLFTISGSSFADNNSSVRFTEAQNNYEKAKADYERMKSLSQDKIVPEKDLLAAKNLFDNTKAIFDNLNANFSAKGQHITSPMSGFVRSVYVKNGQYVEAGQPLLAVSKNRTLIISAEVQQKYAGILGNITNANLRTFHGNKTYSLKELNGKLLSFGHSLSENNYLIPVNLEIDNKSDFIPGSFIELYLKTITNSQALTIPNDALMEDQGTFYVYVQIYPELFERREVKPGATDGIRTEVITGIATGDRIITKGAALVKLAQATSSLDAHSGHNH
jgi:RND family efflux transporter MFP subunit